MDCVGEIDWRGLSRKHDHAASRGECVDLLGVQIHFESGQEVTRVPHLALPFDELPKPCYALIVGSRSLATLFVFPVRGDPFFRELVHLLSSNLNLKCDAAGTNHRRMQRLIQVRPRHSDKIFDPAGHRMPFVVNHSQRRVAILH